VETLGALLARGENSLLRLVEVRRPLETEIASLAAERAAPGDVAALEEAIREMLSAGSMEARVEADLRFHDRLAAATGNPVFQILLATMAELMHRSRRQTLARSGVDAAVEGHRAVLAAVARHDPQAARQTMLDHLAKAERDLRGESP